MFYKTDIHNAYWSMTFTVGRRVVVYLCPFWTADGDVQVQVQTNAANMHV